MYPLPQCAHLFARVAGESVPQGGIGYTYPWIEEQVQAKVEAASDKGPAVEAMAHSEVS